MTPTRRENLQSAVLAGVKRDHPGTTDGDIAAAAGCCRPHISDLRHGSREFGLSNLVGMIEEFGSRTVLGPIAALDGCAVVAGRSRVSEDPTTAAMDIADPLGTLMQRFVLALRDGRLSPAERAEMLPSARELYRELGEWIDAEGAAQAALPMPRRGAA